LRKARGLYRGDSRRQARDGEFRAEHFLPGGGSRPGETPEESVAREVHEELGQRLHLLRPLGEATQYFFSADDDRHYEMRATFFTGEFTGVESDSTGDHQLDWLPVTEPDLAFFHECHAWAVRQALNDRPTEVCRTV
jgi:8-oxo-dGTP pyrophosphatase MutT (NUDIX family)